MQGYKLDEGKYREGYLTQEDMWKSFNWLFSKCSKNDTSYKFIFLKAIIECIDRKDTRGRISFDILFDEFTRISWNLILKYDIEQKAEVVDGRKSAIERVLEPYKDYYCEYDDLFKEEKEKIVQKVKAQCKKYVVGALYGDTYQLLYSFSKKEEWIEINPQMERFIKENTVIIENLNYFKWAKFYENLNTSTKTEAMLNSVDCAFIRKNENVYRAILAFEFETLKGKQDARINSLNILLQDSNKEIDALNLDEDEVDNELYKDFLHMKEYMEDPILLVKHLKDEKGLI